MKKRKIIAALMSLIMSASVFTGCGDTAETENISVTENFSDSSEERPEKETESEKTGSEFFNDEYDPFAEDYDPYENGGGYVETDTGKSTDLSETETESQSAEALSNGAESKSDKNSDEKSNKKSDKTESSDSKKVSLEINNSNSWNDGKNDFSQIDVSVKNNSDKTLNGWTVTIDAGKDSSVEQSWGCEISEKDGVYTVTPANYNSNIESGQSGSFGIIFKNPDKITKDKASVKSGGFSASADMSNNNNNNNNDNNKNNGAPVDPNTGKAHEKRDIPKPTTNDWLHTDGSKILDSEGREVWLTGINWFGYNTGTNTFDGLWACDLETSIDEIANHGFNLLRIPISSELIKKWSEGEYPTANFNQATNYYLVGMNSLEIFDYAVSLCRADGIKIMIDIHCADTDASGHMKPMWYGDRITEKDYLDSLAWIADRYKKDDTIIAYDLENEPHGKPNENPRAKWDNSKDSDNWKYVAEKAAKKVLSKNPNVLVMIEGIEIYPKDIKKNGDFSSTNSDDYYFNWWGGNLRGVKDNPIELGKYNNKIVYSPHDYGPTVYEQPWFKGNYTQKSLIDNVWYDNWFYIQDKDIAPLLIGEWGGFMREPNLKWMTYLRDFIKKNRINHTFWCFNANSGDTGGLVKDDFVTWDTEKYNFVKEVLWQQNGKFVGLDHDIPLGDNGITLSEIKKK